jgi:hypothetical protein
MAPSSLRGAPQLPSQGIFKPAFKTLRRTWPHPRIGHLYVMLMRSIRSMADGPLLGIDYVRDFQYCKPQRCHFISVRANCAREPRRPSQMACDHTHVYAGQSGKYFSSLTLFKSRRLPYLRPNPAFEGSLRASLPTCLTSLCSTSLPLEVANSRARCASASCRSI